MIKPATRPGQVLLLDFLMIVHTTLLAYSVTSIRLGLPPPWALAKMMSSIGLYNEFGGSLKSSKYVKPLVCTTPVTTDNTLTYNTLTLKGDSSKRRVSPMISMDLFAAAYDPVILVRRLNILSTKGKDLLIHGVFR